MRQLFLFLSAFLLCGCAANKSTVQGAWPDDCGMLSFQESHLNDQEKMDLKKYGIIAHGAGPAYFLKKGVPCIIISKGIIPNCKTRAAMSRYFHNLIWYGCDYENFDKTNARAPLGDLPGPFPIQHEFISKNKELIGKLVYRFLSPKYYGYSRRIHSAQPGEMESCLISAANEKGKVINLRKKLKRQGVPTEYLP